MATPACSSREISAREGDLEVTLTLAETTAPILHGRDGEEGLSRKGPKEGRRRTTIRSPV